MNIRGQRGSFNPLSMGITVVVWSSFIFYFFIPRESSETNQLFWWLYAGSLIFIIFIYIPINMIIYSLDPASPALGLIFGFFIALVGIVFVHFFTLDAELKVIIPFIAFMSLVVIEFFIDISIICVDVIKNIKEHTDKDQ